VQVSLLLLNAVKQTKARIGFEIYLVDNDPKVKVMKKSWFQLMLRASLLVALLVAGADSLIAQPPPPPPPPPSNITLDIGLGLLLIVLIWIGIRYISKNRVTSS